MGGPLQRVRGPTVAGWATAVAVIVVSVVWGRSYQRDVPEIFLGAAPFVGRDPLDGWDWRFGWGLLGAGAVAVAVVWSVQVGWWETVRLRWVVAASSLGAGAFAFLLAFTDGADGVLHGATDPTEYLANLVASPPARELLRTFVDRIDDYSVHVRGHPPGFLLLLTAMDALGAASGWPVALLSLAATIAVPAAVLVTIRTLVDADWVRRVAPFLVVSPAALWMVTSADAVYAAAGAWGVAAGALAVRVEGWRAVASGAAAGLLLSALLFGTYGGVTFLLLPLAIVLAARRARRPVLRPTIAAIATAIGVTAAFALAGFWWFAGATATTRQYYRGTADVRSWTYFGVANLAVALVAMGPAVFAGLLGLRDRRVWVMVGGALAALALSHLSQYTKAEVERIWLLFFPWITVAAGAVVLARWRAATWVGAQAITAILLQAALVSKW